MNILSIARATEPHLPSLAVTLAPLLNVAGAGSFWLCYQNGLVLIEQASFTGVNQTSVVTAVAAAPVRTAVLDDKDTIDAMPLWLKAAFLVALDQINILRTQPTTVFTAVTAAQFMTAVKNKRDTL
jgi:hypothetical protein